MPALYNIGDKVVLNELGLTTLYNREGYTGVAFTISESWYNRYGESYAYRFEEIDMSVRENQIEIATSENTADEFLCPYCGGIHPISDMRFLREPMCVDCYEQRHTNCVECGRRIETNDYFCTTDGNHVCPDCFDESYNRCCHCGNVMRLDASYYMGGDTHHESPYCGGCFEWERNRVIHRFDYKPDTLHFHKCDNEDNYQRYFGVELEIAGAGESEERAKSIIAVANADAENVYIKHDGSLTNDDDEVDGFEIVTEPCTLRYHHEEMPWKQITDKARSLGYLSHQTGVCGLHVHVNRESLGMTEDERDATIANILYFVEHHWNELVLFSRRTEGSINRWASRYGYKTNARDILRKAKDIANMGHDGRYTCVNLTNRNTIEFRIFRGTLNVNTIMATLQLVNRICDIARRQSCTEIQRRSWTRFVLSLDPNREAELIVYLKQRQLYVNDAVESLNDEEE